MSDFMEAIDDLIKEKGLTKEIVMEAIESALVAAYKKNYGTSQNVRVAFDGGMEGLEVLMRKDVVEEVEDEFTQISLEEALEIDDRYQVGDVVEYQVTPENFGRIAAQTAKQVVVQKIREAERGVVFGNYINRQGDLITGVVQRISNETIFVNIGNTEGILVARERAPGERFRVNDRIKAYIMDVRKSAKGPQIFLSRTHPGFVERLFELEVPEIEDGIVEIKSIAREAGSRTKIAVYTEDEDEDPYVLIRNVLSPAEVEEVFLDEELMEATVVVPDYQLSLAIGKEGQNVRLAARLSGWKIDIKSHAQYYGDEGYDEEYYEEYEEEGEAGEIIEEVAEDAGEVVEEAAEVAEEEDVEAVEEAAEEEAGEIVEEAEETEGSGEIVEESDEE